MEVAQPHILSRCSSGRRSSSVCNSPEFEFWMISNNNDNSKPSGFLQPENLLTADELFVDGFLLPLHRLHLQQPANPPPPPPPCILKPPPPAAAVAPPTSTAYSARPELASAADESITGSKRWKDIFKKSDRKKEQDNKVKVKKEEKKKDNTRSTGITTASSELNIINMWPFSRSRSDGNGGPSNRPAGTRKVSSAPCSRSNSQGDSKSRKWPSSPSRGGVHLGRSSPVWQVRRSGLGSKSSSKSKALTGGSGSSGGGGKGKVLNLNVPMCIGYKQHLSCKSDESSFIQGVTGGRGSGGDKHIGGGNGGSDDKHIGGGNGGSDTAGVNLRSLFTSVIKIVI